jgi:predicted transcriptional regulator of viral defense system
MRPRTAVAVPAELARRPVGVFRPADAADVYAYPRGEVARLTRRGALRRLAPGYYVRVPTSRVGDPGWRPELEAAAWGIAAATYGPTEVALMGLSAARLHGAIPRALGVAVVAVPKQRPRLQVLDDATVVFVRRHVADVDVERMTTELGDAYVTTSEQTVLDLAARPLLGNLAAEAEAAALTLLARCDRSLLQELAATQRRRSALRRLLQLEESARA